MLTGFERVSAHRRQVWAAGSRPLSPAHRLWSAPPNPNLCRPERCFSSSSFCAPPTESSRMLWTALGARGEAVPVLAVWRSVAILALTEAAFLLPQPGLPGLFQSRFHLQIKMSPGRHTGDQVWSQGPGKYRVPEAYAERVAPWWHPWVTLCAAPDHARRVKSQIPELALAYSEILILLITRSPRCCKLVTRHRAPGTIFDFGLSFKSGCPAL